MKKSKVIAAVLGAIMFSVCIISSLGCGLLSNDSIFECSHEWQNATCTSPMTCSLCGETAGEPYGHTWDEATCTSPMTCSECGITRGQAKEHSFTKGLCDDCGAADPDYKTPHQLLKDYIYSNGEYNYDTEGYELTLNTFYSDSTYFKRYAFYDVSDDEITLYLFATSTSSSYYHLYGINLGSQESSSYEWSSIDSYKEFMTGYIYPSSYTEYSTLTYNYTDGFLSSSTITSTINLNSTCADNILDNFSSDFSSIGLTPSDFGFVHFD